MSSTARVLVALATLAVVEVAAQVTAVTSTLSISAPTTLPAGSFIVPPDFIGVGFETAYLPSYNNEFSENLVNSLASRLASPPTIRVGGTSGDMVTFDPNQAAATWCPTGNCAGSSDAHFILGPSYFDTFSSFQSAHFTFQAPLGTNPNASNIIDYVQRAYNAAGASRVDAIALGNEVNWYVDTAAQYVGLAQTAKEAITSVLNLTSPIWEILDSAGGAGNPYSVEGVYEQGINDDGLVKYVAEHYYQYGGNVAGITEYLLNHTALKAKFDNYLEAIQYTLSTPNTKFILSETGGPLDITSAEQYYFANTLWSANFRLYAMTKGVSRVEGTQRPITLRSLWIPEAGWATGVGARVQAPYYALPFVADFIGKTATGDRGVANLNLGQESMSAYAMFEGDSLERIAVINLHEYTGTGTRDAVQISLDNLGSATQVQVRRLHAAAGIEAGGYDVNGNNITYAGQQWSYDVDQGNGHGTVVIEAYTVTDGAVNIVVPDTEAVIIYTNV